MKTMSANVKRIRLLVDWLDPISALMKIYSVLHAWGNGELNLALNLDAILVILDATVGIFVIIRVISSWVKGRSDEPPETRVLKEFAKLRSKTLCPFARKARLYGGGVCEGQDI